jgi:hypothetical protein
LSGWTAAGPVTVDPLGTSPPAAVLDEDENLRDGTSLRQAFPFPAVGEATISFAFGMLVSGDSSVPFPPDAFLVSVLDPQTLLPVSSITGFPELLAVEFDKFATTFSLNFDRRPCEDVTQALSSSESAARRCCAYPRHRVNDGFAGVSAGGFDGFHAGDRRLRRFGLPV